MSAPPVLVVSLPGPRPWWAARLLDRLCRLARRAVVTVAIDARQRPAPSTASISIVIDARQR